MKQLIICVDYDGTFNVIPKLLTQFITAAKEEGHRVICATMRYEFEGKELTESIGKLCEIIYTNRQAKLPFLHKLGIVPDIWIDNEPHYLFKNPE